jgi:hypothetical protein
LLFGLVTFTWALSGALSLNPWNWSPSSAPTEQQQHAVSGGPLKLDLLTFDRVRESVQQITESFAPKELEVVQFQGEPYFMAYRAPSPRTADQWRNTDLTAFLSTQLALEHRLVSVTNPAAGAFVRFDSESVLAAARQAMAYVAIAEAVWLDEYDSYYRSRYDARPLPVLRVRYSDPDETWLYLNPQNGTIAMRQQRLSRLNRWLYNGLHSFDFEFLLSRRPLWDVVVIVLSIGGILVSGIVMVPIWRRLRRHGRRITGKTRLAQIRTRSQEYTAD